MNADAVFESLGETPAARLKAMMARLRDPAGGCPWDREQSFESIAKYTIEEAYEVVEAINTGQMNELREELGDLLLQVVFHSQMASEQGHFDFDAVCDSIVRKMISRHPHVFGDADERDSAAQTRAWEAIKAEERAQKGDTQISRLDGVALALPALMRAEKLQKRAARAGFDWPDARQVLEKIIEESEEVLAALDAGETQERITDEVGDILFAAANLARKLGVDPEAALRGTNEKFTRRFQYIESNAAQPLEDMPLDDLEQFWVMAKKSGL